MTSHNGTCVFDDTARSVAKNWLVKLKADMEKQPLSQLFSMFKRDTTVLVVNQANAFIKKASSVWETWGEAEEADEAATELMLFRASCTGYLYYRVLHGILQEAKSGSQTPCRSDAAVRSVVGDVRSQLALLNCACELVTLACDSPIAFPRLTLQLGQVDQALELWQAVGHFWMHLSQGQDGLELPSCVTDFLTYIRVRITEQLAWLDGSSLYALMCGERQPGDTALLQEFLVAVNRLAATRISGTCRALAAAVEDVGQVPEVEEDCLHVLDALLVPNLDLLFNQHLSNLVACCIYGAARQHNLILSFKRITGTIMATYPHHTPEVFKQAELTPAQGQEGQRLGDTRELYNEVFLPRMRETLAPKETAQQIVTGKGQSISRVPLRSLSAKDMNSRPQSGTQRIASMRK